MIPVTPEVETSLVSYVRCGFFTLSSSIVRSFGSGIDLKIHIGCRPQPLLE